MYCPELTAHQVWGLTQDQKESFWNLTSICVASLSLFEENSVDPYSGLTKERLLEIVEQNLELLCP